MGRMSRQKGARGEREVIGMLQPIVTEECELAGQPEFILRRNQDQRFAKKQYDIIGLPWMAIEVKRVENQSGLKGWWRQILAATLPGQTPVLIYRPNHQPWTVRMKIPIRAGDVHVKCTATVDIDTFLLWFRMELRSRLH